MARLLAANFFVDLGSSVMKRLSRRMFSRTIGAILAIAAMSIWKLAALDNNRVLVTCAHMASRLALKATNIGFVHFHDLASTAQRAQPPARIDSRMR
jgi:hypothetical protein